MLLPHWLPPGRKQGSNEQRCTIVSRRACAIPDSLQEHEAAGPGADGGGGGGRVPPHPPFRPGRRGCRRRHSARARQHRLQGRDGGAPLPQSRPTGLQIRCPVRARLLNPQLALQVALCPGRLLSWARTRPTGAWQ